MKYLRTVLVLLLWNCVGAAARADELHIAVAANFLGTLQKLAPAFEKHSGHTLVLSGGSSGQIYQQIVHGAPFDIFLSADSERPQKLEAENLTLPGSRFTYAIGKLVLWSPDTGVVDEHGAVLKRGDYRFIAIANPINAPYGAAARQVLEHLQLWDSLKTEHKLVTGESIAQALQYVISGNAQLGFVALSQVRGESGRIKGSWWYPPQSLYQRLDQDAVILRKTRNTEAAKAFMRWLRADAEVRKTILAAGYERAQ